MFFIIFQVFIVFVFLYIFQNFPEADFHFVDDAGHSAKEKGITALLVTAAEKYKHLWKL